MPTQPGTRIEELMDAACWELLESGSLGRIAVTMEDGVDIVPVNYLIKDRLIYFRSAPGSKLVQITQTPTVAFEADGVRDRYRWSVVVKGKAERMSLDTEIEDSGVNRLPSLSPSDKWNYVRIVPAAITGRRFISTRHTSTSA